MNPNIFKAYDVRGVYPTELDEAIFHEIGRAFVTYLKARRIGVGRDMRVSSPGLAAAFIAGAREQGADVVGLRHDRDRHDLLRRRHRRSRRRRADHGVAQSKQYNGCKMVGRGNVPLSGEAGISDIRDMIAGKRIPPPQPNPGI
jgi:phosphomannomutase